MRHPNHQRFDLAVLVVWPIIAVVIGLNVPMNFFFSLLLFMGLPAFYLSVRAPQYIKNTLLFSLVTIPILIVIDYIAHRNGAWLIPGSIFSHRLFGYVTFEAVFWLALQTYFTIIFYEYFVDHHVDKQAWHPRTGMLLRVFAVIGVVFLAIVTTYPDYLHIRYAYLIIAGLLGALPLIVQAFEFPKVTLKIARVAPYFFYLCLLYEIVAVKVGWWSFPGTDFVGWVSFFGVSFPFEEFFFWIVISSVVLLTYYEFCDNDER